MGLSKNIITQVINCCNRDLVPDSSFRGKTSYPSDWFIQYFSFLDDARLEKYLGEAFYQARFLYKLMASLKLPLAKHKGIVRFQIIQYASICEAVLQAAIEKYYKTDFENQYAVTELVKCTNAVSAATRISYDGTNLYLCQEKKKKADIKRTRIDYKTEFAVLHNIISRPTKIAFDALYDSRNNIHILKAANNNYNPKVYESKNAFLLMEIFIGEVKKFYKGQNTGI